MQYRRAIMKTSRALALVTTVILALCAIPANAQPYSRTFVSGLGNNTSTCGARTTPCASFQNALGNTSAGGEIDCLDPGEFGPVTISQSVSIICDGVSNGGILQPSATGIAVYVYNAPSTAVIYLSGLDLEGMDTGGIGVDIISGSTVYVVHSTIRGFPGGAGVWVHSTNTTRAVIKDSIIVNNNEGVAADGQSGAANAAVIVNSLIDGNTVYAAGANNGSTVALVQSVLSGSPIGLDLGSSANGILIGPSNTIAGEIKGTTTSVAFK
jgi:hypothetical protein